MGRQTGIPIDTDIGIPIIIPMESTFTNAVKALIDHFGSQTAAARAIGIKQPTISAWLNEGHGASAKSALRAEHATAGAVRALDLCPDLATTTDTAA